MQINCNVAVLSLSLLHDANSRICGAQFSLRLRGGHLYGHLYTFIHIVGSMICHSHWDVFTLCSDDSAIDNNLDRL